MMTRPSSLTFAAALVLLAVLFSGCGDTREAAETAAPAQILERIESMMSAYDVEGLAVVVVDGQETVLSKGFGVQRDGAPYTELTPNEVFSATKALSSFVFASLVEDGLVGLDVPLGDVLTDPPAEWAGIPFWRLLNHTSGITMIVNRPEFGELMEDPRSTNADIYDAVRQLPLDYQPGEASRYRQSGYAIAEMIVGTQLGKTWPELVEEHLTGPAAAVETVQVQLASGERTGPLLTSAGGYATTAKDMAAIFVALNTGRVVSPEFLEALLYQAEYNFSGYSLGSILETVDGLRTVGHQGGGARATIRYAPSRGVGVAVFTDDTENNDLVIELAAMLVREFALDQRTKPTISIPLLGMRGAPAGEIVSLYETEAARQHSQYDFERSEATLNRMGYAMLEDARTEDAIAVFSLNVREHPASPNAHDSLGEAYFEQGDLDQALESYRRVLDLSPSDSNARTMIERIEADLGRP